MGAMAKKMYGEDGKGPRLKREEESGKMSVKKIDKKEGEDESGSGQTIPVHSRHAMERMEMHHSHMRDHHMHDHGKHGDKKEMHGRHEKMMKEMHARHEKEMGKGE